MNNTKTFSIIAIILGVVSLAVGYAVINSIPLTISGTASAVPNEANFKVYFEDVNPSTDATTTKVNPEDNYIIQTSISKIDDNSATFSATGFKVAGDIAVFRYTITNASSDLTASISVPDIVKTGTYANYFTVTTDWSSVFELAHGASRVLTVTVGLAQNVTEEVTLNDITISFTATAVES